MEERPVRNVRLQKILSYLSKDARAKLTSIARELHIPTSTVFDYMKRIRKEYTFTVVKKDQLLD